MEEGLAEFDHLYRSTDKVLEKLGEVRLTGPTKLVKIDIEDFFIKGDPAVLCKHAFTHVQNGELRGAYEELLHYILTTQYVSSALWSGVIYKCMLGSGIGLRHSAALANIVFARMVETRVVLKPVIQRKFDIRFYGRYHDDILIILAAREVQSLNGIVGLHKLMSK